MYVCYTTNGDIPGYSFCYVTRKESAGGLWVDFIIMKNVFNKKKTEMENFFVKGASTFFALNEFVQFLNRVSLHLFKHVMVPLSNSCKKRNHSSVCVCVCVRFSVQEDAEQGADSPIGDEPLWEPGV